jgi:hypothetical protein
MVILLNYLPVVLLVLSLWLGYGVFRQPTSKSKKVYLTLAILLLLAAVVATPSYAPKGTVPKLPNPPLVSAPAEMQDRLRKPMPPEQRQQEFEKAFDWKDQLVPTPAK